MSKEGEIVGLVDAGEPEMVDVHDVFIAEGEVMIRDIEAFTEQFPFLAAMNRDGQLFLLMPDSGGRFIAIDELLKSKERKLRTVK